MTSSSKPFQLVPPQHIVGEVVDASDSVRSTMGAESHSKPAHVLHVLPQRERAAKAVYETPAELADVELAGVDTDIDLQVQEEETSQFARPAQPMSAAHEIAAMVGHIVPESGPDRQSFFSTYMEEYAKNPKSAINTELMETLNKWFVSLTEATTTAETVIRDFTFAMSEKGAPIDMQLEEFERVVHQLVWMRQLRELLNVLDLGDYVDVILSREIYTEFGRGAEIEAEINKAKKKRGDAENFVQDALNRIVNVLSNMAPRPAPAVQPASVFRPAPRVGPVRAAAAAASPAPATPAATAPVLPA